LEQTIAGITEIVTAMEFLINNPEIKHGKIRVGFTPDEEIGRGAHHFDVEIWCRLGIYYGRKPGRRTRENFNAAEAKITFKGKSVHPATPGKMINSILIANDFINALPKGETPKRLKVTKVSFM
jgi:tripeptide aminopeptidase